MEIEGPKLSAYCPAKNEVSPPVLAIATVLVDGTDEILKYPSLKVPIPVTCNTSPTQSERPTDVKVYAAPTLGEPINVGSNSNFPAPYPDPPSITSNLVTDPPAIVNLAVAPSQVVVPPLNIFIL